MPRPDAVKKALWNLSRSRTTLPPYIGTVLPESRVYLRFVCSLLVVVSLVVNACEVSCAQRLVCEVTCFVSSWMLNCVDLLTWNSVSYGDNSVMCIALMRCCLPI